VGKKTGTRHSPPVANAAYFNVQLWDGRAPTLETQAEGPVQNPVEMANTLKVVEQRLNADTSYREQFFEYHKFLQGCQLFPNGAQLETYF
jgi:cytochrome c peroxidase